MIALFAAAVLASGAPATGPNDKASEPTHGGARLALELGILHLQMTRSEAIEKLKPILSPDWEQLNPENRISVQGRDPDLGLEIFIDVQFRDGRASVIEYSYYGPEKAILDRQAGWVKMLTKKRPPVLARDDTFCWDFGEGTHVTMVRKSKGGETHLYIRGEQLPER